MRNGVHGPWARLVAANAFRPARAACAILACLFLLPPSESRAGMSTSSATGIFANNSEPASATLLGCGALALGSKSQRERNAFL